MVHLWFIMLLLLLAVVSAQNNLPTALEEHLLGQPILMIKGTPQAHGHTPGLLCRFPSGAPTWGA